VVAERHGLRGCDGGGSDEPCCFPSCIASGCDGGGGGEMWGDDSPATTLSQPPRQWSAGELGPCTGHQVCPFCGKEDGPYDPGDGLGCCMRSARPGGGYWDDGHGHDGLGTWRWFHDGQCPPSPHERAPGDGAEG
jgi:hypothetical protein